MANQFYHRLPMNMTINHISVAKIRTKIHQRKLNSASGSRTRVPETSVASDGRDIVQALIETSARQLQIFVISAHPIPTIQMPVVILGQLLNYRYSIHRQLFNSP